MAAFGRIAGFRVTVAALALLAQAVLSAGARAAADGEAVELGSTVPQAKDVEAGLFPDDVCEDLKAHGFKCMGFKPPVRFVLPSSSFQVGSASLPDALKRQLDVFAQVLRTKSGPSRTVRVEGYADASGTPEGNATLSQRRADAARDYLVAKGVSADMLKAVGLGSKVLAVPDQPLSAKNRRVEIGRDQPPPAQ